MQLLFSVQETILSATYVLRNHWNCLRLNKFFSPKLVGSPTRIKEHQFWPKIEFCGIDDKPLKYPTRDICPVQDPLIAAELDRQLDALIQRKLLFYCLHKYNCCLSKCKYSSSNVTTNVYC